MSFLTPGQLGWQFHADETAASIESLGIKMGDGGGNGDACKACATFECAKPDSLETRWELYVRQSGATLECIGIKICDARWK